MQEIGVFDIPPGTRFRRHEHDAPHVCLVLRGGFAERAPGGWRDVGPGTVRVSGPARHACDFGPAGAQCLLIEGADALDSAGTPRFMEGDPVLAGLGRRLGAAVADDDPALGFEAPALTDEFLAQILRRLAGRRTAPPPWLLRVREALHDTGGVVEVAALARNAGVHRVHLAAAFREHYGVPVTRYARQLRLQTAGRLMAGGGLSLARIAARAGFADQSHLTRTMHALWGVTPGALRDSLPAFKTPVASAGQIS